MIFKVSSATLLAVLQNSARVIAPKQTMPILDHFLFELSGSLLTITATDIESTIISEIEVDSVEVEGSAAIPSRLIIESLRQLSDQPVLLSVNEDATEMLLKWETGDMMIPAMNSMGYPQISSEANSESASFSVASTKLLNGISKTLSAAATTDSRIILNSVLIDVDPERLVFVATDAHQLVKVTYDVANLVSEPVMIIVPRKAAGLLKSILYKDEGEVVVEFGGRNLKFSVGEYTYICRGVEGRYPNYNSVIPLNNNNKLTVDRIAFLNSIKRVSVCSNPGNSLVKLTLTENKVALEAKDIDFSTSAKDSIVCSYVGDGIVVGLKSNDLIEMLSVLTSEQVTLEFSDSTRAVLVMPYGEEEDVRVVMLLMPVMI